MPKRFAGCSRCILTGVSVCTRSNVFSVLAPHMSIHSNTRFRAFSETICDEKSEIELMAAHKGQLYFEPSLGMSKRQKADVFLQSEVLYGMRLLSKINTDMIWRIPSPYITCLISSCVLPSMMASSKSKALISFSPIPSLFIELTDKSS